MRGQVLAALRTALVSGDLRPGEVYSAPVLAERFGVSATPVREAMQQLTQEGAVEVVPNRGFRVVERGAREIAELAEVRALIEVPVMLRLARTVPAERWAGLRPLAEATVRAASSGCRATYADADRAFHSAVLALAGNEQLVGIAEELHRRAQWPLVGGAPGGGSRAELIADAHEHTALLDALIAGDLDVVRALVGSTSPGRSRRGHPLRHPGRLKHRPLERTSRAPGPSDAPRAPRIPARRAPHPRTVSRCPASWVTERARVP